MRRRDTLLNRGRLATRGIYTTKVRRKCFLPPFGEAVDERAHSLTTLITYHNGYPYVPCRATCILFSDVESWFKKHAGDCLDHAQGASDGGIMEYVQYDGCIYVRMGTKYQRRAEGEKKQQF